MVFRPGLPKIERDNCEEPVMTANGEGVGVTVIVTELGGRGWSLYCRFIGAEFRLLCEYQSRQSRV